MSAPLLPPRTRTPGSRLPPARVRAWLVAAIAALLVLIYLSVELTYSSTHLDPPRYTPVEPGEVGHGKSADFRLLSLRQTERWGQQSGGEPGAPDPGSVWVVAELEVTPRQREDYLLCSLHLVSTDGRSWDSAFGAPTHEGESCAPDPENVELGTTYPFVLGFQVPATEADHLAGLAVDMFSWRSYPLLRPAA
ncbi:hypothetical protein [Microlunatus antarcticus]|uniref:DUF4352 domain-containing protein n=1 Tax=Microlunatus antarcticus TaxID=53388 RepID=A0A7W5K0B1_9ACTN|nr:hypothetical protein [Microlunatus antarcticus]MBB3329027.1 hypothetical protein [Microlunatus antarcticus]